MSRSKRKTPKTGITTAVSEKWEKRNANRRLRKRVKVQIKKGKLELSKLREISNIWAFGKDGKMYLKDPIAKDLRK